MTSIECVARQHQVPAVHGCIGQVSDKDIAFTSKKLEAEELKAEVHRLATLLKEVSAKEYAMDNATKQNSELLKLLQASEKRNEEVGSAVADSFPCLVPPPA